MTWWMWVLVVAYGPCSGLALFVLLVRKVQDRAYQVCTAQARIDYGPRPAVFEACNPGDVPSPRRRSPDHQLVTTDFPPFVPRPVLHDPPLR